MNGQAEIVGIPVDVLEMFSKRVRQVEDLEQMPLAQAVAARDRLDQQLDTERMLQRLDDLTRRLALGQEPPGLSL